jgi:hypothetical protein
MGRTYREHERASDEHGQLGISSPSTDQISDKIHLISGYRDPIVNLYDRLSESAANPPRPALADDRAGAV